MMNISISSSPASSGTAAPAAAAGAASGAAAGGGFAGVLVQAIGGGSGASNDTAGLPLPLGLIAFVGQQGTQQTEEQTGELLDLLNGLIGQLQELEQGDALSEDVEGQLALLLAAFQGQLRQDDQSQLPSGGATVPALRETLQQLAAAISSGLDDSGQTAALAGQLKSVLDTAAAQEAGRLMNAQAALRPKTDDTVTGKAASETGQAAADNTSVPVAPENKRASQALRDPVWRFSMMTASAEADASGSQQAAAVPSAASADEAGNAGTQPVWNLQQQDALKTADAATAKAAMPAQVPVQQFADQMQKFMVKQFLLTQGNGTAEAKLSLRPEHLGQVDVRIVMQNGLLTAQFMTDNAMARDMLENQMSQLRHALGGQGLQVDRLEVVQQPQASSSASFLHQEQRRQGSGGSGQNSGSRGQGGYEDPASFQAELERTSFLREFGFGSAFNVTA